MKKGGIKVISKIKRSLILLVLSIIVFTNIPNNVYATSKESTSKGSIISPQAEEVAWYFRYVGGGKQKRLWSRTYGHWITDWIWV